MNGEKHPANCNDYDAESLNHLKVVELTLLAVTQIALFYGVKWALTNMDPDKRAAKQKAADIFKRLNLKNLDLNEYEQIIAAEGSIYFHYNYQSYNFINQSLNQMHNIMSLAQYLNCSSHPS